MLHCNCDPHLKISACMSVCARAVCLCINDDDVNNVLHACIIIFSFCNAIFFIDLLTSSRTSNSHSYLAFGLFPSDANGKDNNFNRLRVLLMIIEEQKRVVVLYNQSIGEGT